MPTLRLLVLLAVLLPLPKAHAQTYTGGPTRERAVLRAEEIATAQVINAYEAVYKLRREYLVRGDQHRTVLLGPDERFTPRRDESFKDLASDARAGLRLTVFLDGNELGGVEELRRIQSDQVAEIRFLTGPEAQVQYGPRFVKGVIQVTMRR